MGRVADGWKIDAGHLPEGFGYPRAFDHLIESGTFRLWNWVVLDARRATERLVGLQRRYPARSLVPFAEDLTSDDVFCFELAPTGSRIALIDDHAPVGFEHCATYPDLVVWFREAVAEAANEFEIAAAHDAL